MEWGRYPPSNPAGSRSLGEDVDVIQSEEGVVQPSYLRRINGDLLLYRARLMRRKFRSTPDGAEREDASVQAEKAFRRCLQLNPLDGRAYVGLGTLLQNQRRYTEANDIYEEATTVTSGTNPFIWTAWANLENRRGNSARARKLYEGAVVADSRHAAAWHGWGALEKQQGNLRRAQDIYMRGIKNTKDRPSPYLYQSVALVLEQQGNIEEARKWYIQGAKAKVVRESEALWHSWAKMESLHGNPEVVRYLYQRALEANPKSRYTYASWGVWEKEQGNYENARDLFYQGHELNPRDAAILQAWAILEYESGNTDVARNLLKNATKADPKHIPAWQAWGVLEHVEGNYNRARDLFQQGVWAGPNSADVAKVFQAWAVLERKQNNFNLARTLFSCAVKADSRSQASWLSWAQMEEDLGLPNRAEELRNFNALEQRKIDTSYGPDSVISPLLRGVQNWIKYFSKTSSGKPRDLKQEAKEFDGFNTNFKIPTINNRTTGVRPNTP